MGGSQSVFSGYELAELEYCTFFSQAEIIHIHKEFDRLAKKFDKTADQILTMDQVLSLPVLRFNPFASRICMMFSDDGSGNLAFEHFLDMLSVFSKYADDDVKMSYIFRLFDLDEDGFIAFGDVVGVVGVLNGHVGVGDALKQAQIDQFAARVLAEADLDGDGRISALEFEHLASRIPGFFDMFRISV
eukprot:m.105948 g.105948  ORF g.105948 m.105948 type:complete len:188 (-) comp51666_c0_seq2:50-613(-)